MIHLINIQDRNTLNELRTLLAPHYPSVDPQTVGGRWYGNSHDDKLLACIWCAMDWPFAYIDYLVCDTQRGRGLVVAGWVVNSMMTNGYTRILANIHADNEMMVRVITTLQGGHAPTNGPYYLVDLTGG